MRTTKYHFYLPNYTNISNGIVTLWEAAFEFSLHRDVSISTFFYGEVFCETPIKYCKLIKPYQHSNNIIVVYPDCVEGNPLGAKLVARYLMAKPYILNNRGFKYSDNEFIFAYSNAVNHNLPQYNLIDPKLVELRELKCEKKINRLSIYMGKCRLGIDFKRFIPLLDGFDEIIIITRTHPSNKKCLYDTIAKSKLLLSFDPLSSICYESTLIGTPVLLGDNVFESEYKNYNYPLYGFNYTFEGADFESDSFFWKATKCLDEQIALHDKKTIEIIKKIENVLVTKAESLQDLSKLISHDVNFFNVQWNASPIFNCTTEKSVYRYHLINKAPYLYIAVLQVYRVIQLTRQIKIKYTSVKLQLRALIKKIAGLNHDIIYIKYIINPSSNKINEGLYINKEVQCDISLPLIAPSKKMIKFFWRI